jgi:hypothetical protein
MASQTTTLYNNQVSDLVSSSQSFNRPTDESGKVRCIVDTYTTTSAVTTAQNITLCRLPKGAKVISAELIVPASVGTSDSKLGIGIIDSAGAVSMTATGADDDRFGTGIDLSSAGRKQFVIAAADADYVTTQEVAVVLTPVTTSFADAKTFAFVIQYVIAP